MTVRYKGSPDAGDFLVAQADVVAGDGSTGESGQDHSGAVAAVALAC